MPYPPLKRLSSVCKTFSENIMAILLVVLPNSTILDPSKPKTCPTLRWNHLADAPSRSSLGKAVLYLIQALMNAVPVQFQRSKWRHLLSSSPTPSGSGFPAPAEAGSSHVDGGCSRVAGQGLSFLLNYIILSGMFICLFFFF